MSSRLSRPLPASGAGGRRHRRRQARGRSWQRYIPRAGGRAPSEPGAAGERDHGRINGLIFLVAGTALTQVIIKVLQ
jgi:hypothetical protein